MIKTLSALFTLIFLSGCAGTVQTKKTAFYKSDFVPSGSVFVASPDQKVNDSLEFEKYKGIIEGYFSASGFSISENMDDSDFVAFITYGIDSGKEKVGSAPIFGQTGGGTTYSSGTVYGSGGGYGSYSGSSYSMPTYGVVGSSTYSRTIYTRAVSLDIVKTQSLKENIPKKVFELRAKSSGECGIINGVLPEILEAMFKDFPGKNGETTIVDVSLKSNGC